MPRICVTCQHINLNEINRRLATGEPERSVARAYNLTNSTIHRHRKVCMGLPLPAVIPQQNSRAAVAIATLPSPEKLAGAYQTLALKAHEIVREAQSRQSLAVALNGLNTIRTMLDSIARISGHFGGAAPATNVNVNINVDIKAAIVQEILATIPGTLDAPPAKLEKLIDAAP